jgi:hypothetical protein
MKINNLNHIEVATQEIVGGYRRHKPVYVNTAEASAGALAIGSNTSTYTSTGAFVISGFTSASKSYSGAIAIG